jgi:branched-chain amino acid aminotransferase
MFLVSTTRDVQGVARHDDRELTSPGPVTADCRRVWTEREAEDIDP